MAAGMPCTDLNNEMKIVAETVGYTGTSVGLASVLPYQHFEVGRTPLLHQLMLPDIQVLPEQHAGRRME